MLVGHGYATLSRDGTIVLGSFITYHAHSGYLQVIAGSGLIGLSFFVYQVILYFKFIRSGKEHVYKSRLILCSTLLSAFFLHNISEASIGFQIYPQFIFPVLIANVLWSYEFVFAQTKHSIIIGI